MGHIFHRSPTPPPTGGTDKSVAQHLVRESQFFIEWAVLGINLETDIAFAIDLVDLQRLLNRWKLE